MKATQTLHGMERKNIFLVPPLYFETLATRIWERIQSGDKRR